MEFKKILVRSLSGIIYIAIIVGCILLRSEGIAALTVLFGIYGICYEMAESGRQFANR